MQILLPAGVGQPKLSPSDNATLLLSGYRWYKPKQSHQQFHGFEWESKQLGMLVYTIFFVPV